MGCFPSQEATPTKTILTKQKNQGCHNATVPGGAQLQHMEVQMPEGYAGMNKRGRRLSVSAEVDGGNTAVFIKKVFKKTDEAMNRIKNAVRKSILFSGLDESQQKSIFDAMQEVKVKAGDTIINQGDAGDYFYVIDSGTYDVFKQEHPTDEPNKVFEYRDGSSFGELALMYNCPRAATVKAMTDGSLWRVDRETFRHIIIHSTQKRRADYVKFLDRCIWMNSLSKEDKSQLADGMTTKEVAKGECVIVQGSNWEDHPHLYMILAGECRVVVDGKEIRKLGECEYFGEYALIKKSLPRSASVEASGEQGAKLCVLDLATFERLFIQLRREMEQRFSTYTMPSN